MQFDWPELKINRSEAQRFQFLSSLGYLLTTVSFSITFLISFREAIFGSYVHSCTLGALNSFPSPLLATSSQVQSDWPKLKSNRSAALIFLFLSSLGYSIIPVVLSASFSAPLHVTSELSSTLRALASSSRSLLRPSFKVQFD